MTERTTQTPSILSRLVEVLGGTEEAQQTAAKIGGAIGDVITALSAVNITNTINMSEVALGNVPKIQLPAEVLAAGALVAKEENSGRSVSNA